MCDKPAPAYLQGTGGGNHDQDSAELARQLRDQEAQTALMLNVIQTATLSLDIDQVVTRIRLGLASVIPGSSCSFHLVEGNRCVFPLPVFARLISDDALFSAAVERQRPIACDDAERDPLPHKDAIRRFGIKSIIAVPLVVRNKVLAVAFIATFTAHHFTQREIDLTWGIANVVGLAIRNALLYHQVEQLAVLQERARLAREIHDDLAQQLGNLQLMASLGREYLAQGQTSEAEATIAQLSATISEAHGDLRDAIYDLRSVRSPSLDFLAALQEYLADYRAHYQVNVIFQAPGIEATGVIGRAQVELIRIIQEVLTNARKHAQAKHVWVRIARQGECVEIGIDDDGQGFDQASMSAERGACFGLLVMHERAESIGATLTVQSHPGGGTRILIRYPVPSPEETNE